MFSAELMSMSLKTQEQRIQYIQQYQDGKEGNIYLYGKLLMQNHRFDEAREVLVKILDSEPNRVNSLLCLSDTYRLGGNFEKAMALLKKASIVDPKYDQTHYKMINLLLEQGKSQEAKKCFLQNSSIFSESYPDFWLTKARLQIEEELFDEAKESLQCSIRAINVPYETPFILRSIIALKKGEGIERVQEELQQAIKHTGVQVQKIREKLEETVIILPTLSNNQMHQAIKDILSLDVAAII